MRRVAACSTGEPVAQVAVGVGFHDQAHLTRHFKRHVGTTPARFASGSTRLRSLATISGRRSPMTTVASQRIGTFDAREQPDPLATASAVCGACCALVSISRWPRGASHGGASSITRRWTSRPSGPPSSATRGSWTRASAGSSAIVVGRDVRRVRDQDVDTTAERRGQRIVEVAFVDLAADGRRRCGGRTPPRWDRCRRRGARSRRWCAAIAAPIAPEPQHMSRTTARGRVTAIAWATRNSVRRRGTKTPGSTTIRMPQNSAHPTTCSSGSPAARRSTIDVRSAGVRADGDEQPRLVLGEDAAGGTQPGLDPTGGRLRREVPCPHTAGPSLTRRATARFVDGNGRDRPHAREDPFRGTDPDLADVVSA